MPSLADGTEAMVVRKPRRGRLSPSPRAARSLTRRTCLASIRSRRTAGPRSFAVNLDPSESKTSPLAVETLEQFGCRLVNPTRAQVDREPLRQMQNAELESRQKLWRWLILAAIGVLILGNLAGGPDQAAKPDPRGGPVDMSGKLRQALEQVASRFRHVRFWGGLAACWLLLAVAGFAISTLAPGVGLGSIPAVWILAAIAVLAVVSGIACFLLAARSARDPRWVARRIEAKHPELGTEPACRRRGGRGRARRSPRFLASDRRPRSPGAPTVPRLG